MRIIGRTEAGAKLVEISTAEMMAINAAAQTLNSMSLHFVIVGETVPAGNATHSVASGPLDQPPPAVGKKIKRARAFRQAQGPGRTSAAPTTLKELRRAGPTKSSDHKCLYCKKPLPKNAHPSMKTHNGECKTMYAREYARNYWREKHKGSAEASGIKMPEGNPADPGLTDQARAKLIANRSAVLKTINERIESRGN